LFGFEFRDLRAVVTFHHRQDSAIKEWREQLQKAKYRLMD